MCLAAVGGYILKEVLGSGGFGKVYKGMHPETGESRSPTLQQHSKHLSTVPNTHTKGVFGAGSAQLRYSEAHHTQKPENV